VFTPGIEADALRSLKAPGHAYDNDTFGKDPQPAHMDDYADLPDTDEGDNGGVHINSGIPNHAFYLAAVAIGGYAWEVAGRIWYQSLRASTPTTDFAAFAETTISKAGELYGAGGGQQTAVREAWEQVGVGTTAPRGGTKPSAAVIPPPREELVRQFDELTAQVNRLRSELLPS
jgi:Zn-dependent metalloprotease